MKPAILLMGPTASGKTALAVELARRLDGEIVSVDSALVYRGLDIGTAKPSAELRRRVPHHMVDVADPADPWSAGRFRDAALECMEGIATRGRLPLLAGGTGLYFRAIERGLDALPPADPALRAALDAEGTARGWPALHAELAEVDPTAAARIRPTDAQRIQRALEVWRLSGRPLSELQAGGSGPPAGWRFRKLALATPRDGLHRRIEARFDAMLAAGLAEEVRALHARGDLHAGLPAVRAVGYRQLWEWLEGRISLEEARRRAIVATRRLAKRQMTWLRAEPGLEWLDGESLDAGVLAGRLAAWAASACRGAVID